MERKIKIFSFAAILMLAALVLGCKHNVTNNTPETCSVTFSVNGAGGTLKAKVEGGSEINSGNTVEHGKTVIFTAEPNDYYEVDKWTITGSAFETGTGTGGSTTAKVKITATVNITVSFKLNKYPVTFSVDGAGGTLKAKADGVAETETSPITVEHGKTVTLTAAPAAGYKVKEWKLGGNAVNGTNMSYPHTITQAINVTVSFELGKAFLTLEAGKHTVKVKAKTADGSAIKVEGCTVTELANEAETTLTVTNPERKLALIGNIIELDCRGEKTPGGNRPLIALDVSGCTALQKLNCQFNYITALDVSGLTALQKLYCNDSRPHVDRYLSELNVQGCTSLKELRCYYNKLDANAFIKIFNDLPTREASDGAKAVLYKDRADSEENCKDFTQPESLKKAFEGAKAKHWKLQKLALDFEEDI